MTDHFLRQSFFHFGELILMFLKDLIIVICLAGPWETDLSFCIGLSFCFFAGKILPVFEMSPYDIDLSKWQVSCLCKKGKCRNFHHCKLANSKRCTTIHICILLQTFRSCFYISQTKNKTFQALVDWTTYSL